jgi:hypothetical protein
MGKRLTSEEWHDLKPPFQWMRVRQETWPKFLFEIAEKHLYNATQGYWYHMDEGSGKHLFIFEEQTDMVAFKLWLASEPFEKDFGEIG